jgi:flagellar assembly protein FliH
MSDNPTGHTAKRANYARQIDGHSTVIHKEQLTAFERWELATLDPRSGSPLQAGTKKPTMLATVAELENIRQQAHDDGHTQGHAAGYTAGMQQARTEALQIGALLQNLQVALNRVDEQIAQSLLDLSLEIAHRMIGETLRVKPEVILKIVGNAIRDLPHFNQNAHLVLHPEDADLVRKHMGEQLSHAGWKILADPEIGRGGCRVETSHRQVDATTEARWKRIVESIGQDDPWLI